MGPSVETQVALLRQELDRLIERQKEHHEIGQEQMRGLQASVATNSERLQRLQIQSVVGKELSASRRWLISTLLIIFGSAAGSAIISKLELFK